MNASFPFYLFLADQQTRVNLVSWWASLKEKPGHRARLRRVQRPDDALLTEPFFHFLQQMPASWSTPDHLLPSAMVAAALAHVKENSKAGQSFAQKLASGREGRDKPAVSELRFQQLQKSRDPDIFFRRLLRAIRLAESRVNILSLADNILHWMHEYHFGTGREPLKRLAVRWASDYYTTLNKQSATQGGK